MILWMNKIISVLRNQLTSGEIFVAHSKNYFADTVPEFSFSLSFFLSFSYPFIITKGTKKNYVKNSNNFNVFYETTFTT